MIPQNCLASIRDQSNEGLVDKHLAADNHPAESDTETTRAPRQAQGSSDRARKRDWTQSKACDQLYHAFKDVTCHKGFEERHDATGDDPRSKVQPKLYIALLCGFGEIG